MEGRSAHHVIIGIWVLVFAVEEWFCCCFGCVDQERTALLDLKNSFNATTSTRLDSWIAGTDCCLWEGVNCSRVTGRVIELSADDVKWNANENWYLNSSLLLPFKELKKLDLSFNRMRGFTDSEAFDRWSKMTALEDLDISSNRLNETVVPFVCALKSLKYLRIGYNLDFNGSVPITELITCLRELELLDLSVGVSGGGPIPSSIESLTSLKALSLLGNGLGDSHSIQVAHNNLSGKTPDMVSQFATFDEGSYEGNPFLCGPPLKKNCTSATHTNTTLGHEEKDDKDDHLVTFYASFLGSYCIFLLGTIIVLYYSSQRRAVCFLHGVDSWCAFHLYKICKLFYCK